MFRKYFCIFLSSPSFETAPHPLTCEPADPVTYNSSQHVEIVAVCSRDTHITDMSSGLGQSWIEVPMERTKSCSIFIRPIIASYVFKFDSISLEISGASKIQILLDGIVIVDWVRDHYFISNRNISRPPQPFLVEG